MNGGRYEPARLLSAAGGVRTYYVAVPKNSSYRVIVSTTLTWAGAAAPAAAPTPGSMVPSETMTINTGASDITVDLGTAH